MMEPGSARSPRSTRGVMCTRVIRHDASDAAQIGCQHHGGDGEGRAPGAGDECVKRRHFINIPVATPARAPTTMNR